jgi:hypothetical protein
MKISEWDLGVSSRDIEDLKGVLELVSNMKKRGGGGGQKLQSPGHFASG